MVPWLTDWPGAPTPRLRDILAVNLRGARAEAGLTKLHLVNLSSVAMKHISNIESANANVTIELLEALPRPLDRTPAELLTPRPPRRG